MAYNQKNLSVLSYGNGFTLWHYATDNTGAEVLKAGYFHKASDMLSTGDVIICATDTGTVAQTGFLSVAGRSAGLVLVEQVKGIS